MTDETHRDSIAEILERIAKEGLPNPRDLDVALDAILSEESAYINRQQARIEELEALAQALIDDVRARYPGEELRCPHMIALDEALKGTEHDG